MKIFKRIKNRKALIKHLRDELSKQQAVIANRDLKLLKANLKLKGIVIDLEHEHIEVIDDNLTIHELYDELINVFDSYLLISYSYPFQWKTDNEIVLQEKWSITYRGKKYGYHPGELTIKCEVDEN